MPKVSDAHRESRRDQIARAALRLFAEKGFHRTSMADIIEASGLSAGAIYGYFASKQEIVMSVAERVLGGRLRELDDLAAGPVLPDPPIVLRGLLEAVTHELADPGLLLQLWGEAATDPELHRLVQGVFARIRAGVTGYLSVWAQRSRGLDPADAEAWAERMFPAVFAFGPGYVVQSTLLPSFDADAYFAAMRELLA